MTIANLSCTYQSILDNNLSLQQKCSLISTACNNQQFYINFFDFFYCKLVGKIFYLIPLAVIMLVLIFVFLNSISEQTIAPAFVYVSKYFKIPKKISKITLLVLACNLDDFVASYVILSHKNQFGMFYGNLLGSVLIFLTLVFGLCLKNVIIKIKLKRQRMVKDLCLLMSLLIVLAYFGYKKILSSLFCYVMILFYVVYAVVELTKTISKRKKSQHGQLQQDQQDEENLELLQTQNRNQRRSFHEKKMLLKQVRVLLKDYYDYVENKTQIRIENFAIEPYQKYFNFLDFPMKIIRCLTIPPSNEQNYSHDLTIIWPFGGLYFLTWYFFSLSKWQVFIMPVSFGISILFCKYNSGNVDEIPRYFILMTFIAIFISVLWLNIIFGILIDFLVFVQILTNISGLQQGMILLAWICALPEALSLISIFKRQNSQVAYQGFLQGKIVSLVSNFGFLFLYFIKKFGDYQFDLLDYQNNFLQLVLLTFTFISALFLLLYGIKKRMVFRREFYRYQYIIYLLFVLAVVGSSIKLKFFNQILLEQLQMNYLGDMNIKEKTEEIKNNQKKEQTKKLRDNTAYKQQFNRIELKEK